jgi:tungstate transport system substrate-binding protein
MLKHLSVGLLAVLLVAAVQASAETRIKCASTTSTQNSGLLDYLLPIFENKTGLKVDVVAVGTGAAIEIGKRGDADVVMVHAKDQELKAVQEGWFVNRHDLMYNDFVVIGPPQDPAQIKGVKSARPPSSKSPPRARSSSPGGINPAPTAKSCPSGKKPASNPRARNGTWKWGKAWPKPSASPTKNGPIR